MVVCIFRVDFCSSEYMICVLQCFACLHSSCAAPIVVKYRSDFECCEIAWHADCFVVFVWFCETRRNLLTISREWSLWSGEYVFENSSSFYQEDQQKKKKKKKTWTLPLQSTSIAGGRSPPPPQERTDRTRRTDGCGGSPPPEGQQWLWMTRVHIVVVFDWVLHSPGVVNRTWGWLDPVRKPLHPSSWVVYWNRF